MKGRKEFLILRSAMQAHRTKKFVDSGFVKNMWWTRYQLAKMKSLKGILTAPDKKLRLDTLNKCEDVLHKLYEKVEGPPPVSSTTVSVSGMFYKQWLIKNSKNYWLTQKKKAISLSQKINKQLQEILRK